MRTNFLLGKITISKQARVALKREPLDLVARHAVNDHGLADIHQLRRNLEALHTAEEIVSIFHIDPTNPEDGRVLVITDEGWGNTLVKLEHEP